jgi:hypothetical protein
VRVFLHEIKEILYLEIRIAGVYEQCCYFQHLVDITEAVCLFVISVTNRLSTEFNFQGYVHLKNILIYNQQIATLHSLFYLETALNVSGGTTTHHQERI